MIDFDSAHTIMDMVFQKRIEEYNEGISVLEREQLLPLPRTNAYDYSHPVAKKEQSRTTVSLSTSKKTTKRNK